MQVQDRIGISTHFMPSTHGEDIFDAVRLVAEAGFRGFEIVPTKDQAQIGWRYNHPNVGIEPLEMSGQQIEELKDALSVFEFVTVHSPHLGINIASTNRHVRAASERVYMSCLELAVRLGVQVVTFHPGGDTWGYVSAPEVRVGREIEMGCRILRFAQDHGLKVGYEVCASFEHMKRIVNGVGGEFGLNLDIGHALMGVGSDDWLELYASEFKGRIYEVHLNGVCHYWGGFMEHQPPHLNNAIDYQATFVRLRDDGYEGPFICEIQGNDLEQVIRHCQETKDMLCGIWRGELRLRERWNVPG